MSGVEGGDEGWEWGVAEEKGLSENGAIMRVLER